MVEIFIKLFMRKFKEKNVSKTKMWINYGEKCLEKKDEI